jgi:hypothetical protein
MNRIFVGQDVPPGNLQILHGLWNGSTFQNNIYAPLNGNEQAYRPHSYINLELQNHYNNNLTLKNKLPNIASMKAPVDSLDGSATKSVNAVQESPPGVESESGYQVPTVMA